MSLASSLNPILPLKFFGVIPLHIGVEIILGVAILNKAGGIYGILSLLTGHPINFWQWLYNFLAIIVLPVYISSLMNLNNRANNARKTALACVVYVADTLLGLLYTVYFIYFWFSREDNNPTETGSSMSNYKRAVSSSGSGSSGSAKALSSQSASPARELFLTTSTVMVVTVFRLYSTLVFLSFTRALCKQDVNTQRYDNVNDDEDIEVLLKSERSVSAKVKLFIYELEMKAKELLRDFFR